MADLNAICRRKYRTMAMLINLLQYLQNSSGEKGKRYFEKNVKSLRSQFTTYNNNKNWFDDECKRKRQLYRKAMGDYNKSQTAVNRVFSSKKDLSISVVK